MPLFFCIIPLSSLGPLRCVNTSPVTSPYSVHLAGPILELKLWHAATSQGGEGKCGGSGGPSHGGSAGVCEEYPPGGHAAAAARQAIQGAPWPPSCCYLHSSPLEVFSAISFVFIDIQDVGGRKWAAMLPPTKALTLPLCHFPTVPSPPLPPPSAPSSPRPTFLPISTQVPKSWRTPLLTFCN